MVELKAKLTLFEDLLGTSPNNKDLYYDYVGSKAPNAATMEEEVADLGVENVAQKGMTVFSKDENGIPFVYDYMVRGFFKSAAQANKKIKGSKSADLKAFKKEIDMLVMVYPRKIKVNLSGPMTECQRPLRASTPQGERVSLAISESIPAQSWMTIRVRCLNDDDTKFVREWLDYGLYNGLGQWRNSGKGRFYWEELDKDGQVIGGNRKMYEKMVRDGDI